MTRRVSMNRPVDWLSSGARKARVKSRRRRFLLLGAGVLVLAPVYYGLAFGRVVINGSDSLEANAFLMVTWPKWVVPGAIVAMEMPDPLVAGLKLKKDQAVYVKRVLGVAGDPVETRGTAVCLKDRCLTQFERSKGRPLDLWTGTDVPEGTVFVAGDSSSSLDSRYALIGPRPLGDVIAVGVPVRFPHWEKLRAILDRGG